MEPDKWKRAKAKAGTSKKLFFLSPKEDMGDFFFFFQIYNRLKHDKKTPIIKSELII